LDDVELAEFRSTLRHLLDTASPSAAVAGLVDSGWSEVYDQDPGEALAALFHMKGETLAAASLYELVAAPFAGRDPLRCRIVFPAAAKATPGEVDGYTSGPLSDDLDLLIIDDWHGRSSVRVVPLAAAQLDVLPVTGLDAEAGVTRVSGSYQGGNGFLEGEAAAGLVDVLRLALAHELIGQTSQMLRLAIEHVTVREQFGRPLGSFQAVRHRLADVAVLAAGATSVAAAVTPGAGPDHNGSDVAPRVALVAAAAAAAAARGNCLQVCGAIGFTWEFALHRYMRRSLVLDALSGSRVAVAADLGRSLIDARQVPRIGDVQAQRR
jgi:hypothetical protein